MAAVWRGDKRRNIKSSARVFEALLKQHDTSVPDENDSVSMSAREIVSERLQAATFMGLIPLKTALHNGFQSQ